MSVDRILVLAPEMPYPPHWGFGARVFQLARHLARRSSVSLLAYGRATDHDRLEPLQDVFAEIHLVEPPAGSKRLAQLRSLASSRSHHLASLTTRTMQGRLRSLLGSPRGYDLVQVESSRMAGFDFGMATVLLDEHNIEYELLHRIGGIERNPVRKAFSHLEYRKVSSEEKAAWRSSAGIVFTSDRERAAASAMVPGLRTAVIPNGVDLEHFRPSVPAETGRGVVFTGSMNYRPNTDAAVFLITEIMPRVWARDPSVTVTIAGQGAPPALVRLAGPRVRFTGAVTDMRPYIREAGVVAVPLRMGSGTRIKVLEALAMAKPVVSTAVGSEGLGVEDGAHVLIADDADTFAQSLYQLLVDHHLARRLGEAGHRLVERDYGWDRVSDRLAEFQDELVAGLRTPVTASSAT